MKSRKPTPEEEPEEDAAPRGKTTFELFGEPLRPYSLSRSLAAQTIGVCFPNIGEEGKAQFDRVGTYPGMLRDVLAILWLCTLSDPSELSRDDIREGKWTPISAAQKPSLAYAELIAWGEAQDLADLNSERFSEACQTAFAIVGRVEAAKFQIVTNESGPSDEPGKV